ncbi:hypothetical protein UFOVP426_27 [uncultured Caudovirales phage]|uniref:Uncharacterized protein n=1 Tax=uncultured Caudovirales phage TaxID=2100421 RepID=A0A6J5M7X3_9CAUD|nr:hypothetical protein UFOVP426_27 [uncultured Caudovirales phage]
MHRIFNYRNPSKHLIMNAIETLIYTLETQLKTMPSGYVKETVTACKELAEGIKAIYENPNNNISNEPNQD